MQEIKKLANWEELNILEDFYYCSSNSNSSGLGIFVNRYKFKVTRIYRHHQLIILKLIPHQSNWELYLISTYINPYKWIDNEMILEKLDDSIKLWMLDDIDLIIAGDFNQHITNFKSKAQLYKLNMIRYNKTRRPKNAKETDMIISTLHLNNYEAKDEDFISDHLIIKAEIKINICKHIYYRLITNKMVMMNMTNKTIK